MYIKYKDKKYSCKNCSITKNSIIYRGIEESFQTPIEGEICLYSDNDFVMRTDKVSDYLRQTFANGILTLTNIHETNETEIEVSNEPSMIEQLRADVDYIAIMTGVEL